MRTQKVCLGVAVAGVMSLGSLAAAAVADADSSGNDPGPSNTAASSSGESADAGSSSPRSRTRASSGEAPVRAGERNAAGSKDAAGSKAAGSTEADSHAQQSDNDADVRLSRLARAVGASTESASAPVRAAAQVRVAEAAPSAPAAAVAAEAAASASIAEAAPTSDQSAGAPVALAATAPVAAVPVRPARAPVPLLPLPLPTLPVLPASAATVPTSVMTGRSRGVNAAAAVTMISEQYQPLSAGAAQHVLLIGIDGTDLSSILADPANQNLFNLMNNGTTAVSTIVGHTTISNPSWTGVLTGVWSETAGVINNVFTPWTYDTWPTVFNQLETYDPTIETTTIANWSVIAQISGAGSIPADTILYYPKINDSWLDTDDAVGAASIDAILNTAPGTPNFQFTYFVGVDETGHEFGGSGTPEYAEALRNVDQNVGDIMAAVDAWELANPGEEWTVIVTTDHGQAAHRPGFIVHGFQSPPETTTFVIANGDGFVPGAVNNTYLNIDVTPTVMQLFGIAPEPYSEGKPLIDRSANDYMPILPGQDALHLALSDAIAMYGYPDIQTDLALAVRTIAATVPYVVYTIFNDLAATVPDFLEFPVQLIGAIIYQMVNIPAQIIARLTGVEGNSIIPPEWWPYNPVPGTQTPPSAEVLRAPAPVCVDVCLAS
jgi:hypothetical protein